MKMANWIWNQKSKNPDEGPQQDLKKGEFDSNQIQVQKVQDQQLKHWQSQQQGFIDPPFQQAISLIFQFKYFQSFIQIFFNQDQHRHALAYSKSGKICRDKQNVNKIRSIGKEMLKFIGKKVSLGDINLTHISFPIRAMVPKELFKIRQQDVQQVIFLGCMMPYFTHRAVKTQHSVQRMKLCLTGIVSAFYRMNLFLKILNSEIGETLQGSYADGSKVYVQKISHHPPISYFLLIGYDNSYCYSGYYDFEANAGLISMNLMYREKKIIRIQRWSKNNW